MEWQRQDSSALLGKVAGLGSLWHYTGSSCQQCMSRSSPNRRLAGGFLLGKAMALLIQPGTGIQPRRYQQKMQLRGRSGRRIRQGSHV